MVRLPVLIGSFKIPPLEAVIFNKVMSLAVVAIALIFRTKSISLDQLVAHLDIVINLLAGSLIGAWWAAGRTIKMSKIWGADHLAGQNHSSSACFTVVRHAL